MLVCYTVKGQNKLSTTNAAISDEYRMNFIPVSVLTQLFSCLFTGKVVYVLKWVDQPCMQPIQYYEDGDFVIKNGSADEDYKN